MRTMRFNNKSLCCYLSIGWWNRERLIIDRGKFISVNWRSNLVYIARFWGHMLRIQHRWETDLWKLKPNLYTKIKDIRDKQGNPTSKKWKQTNKNSLLHNKKAMTLPLFFWKSKNVTFEFRYMNKDLRIVITKNHWIKTNSREVWWRVL